MRIGITGGTGFVGGHLAAALSGAGHEVVLTARGVDQRPWAQQVRSLPGIETFRAGLDDVERLAPAFQGCQAVAHCAGINREVGAATYQAVHVDGRLSRKTVPILGPTELAFDDVARRVPRILGKKRLFVRARSRSTACSRPCPRRRWRSR